MTAMPEPSRLVAQSQVIPSDVAQGAAMLRVGDARPAPADAPRLTEDLTRDECLRLLGSVTVGRIVFTLNALPAIRPVNHVVDNGSIIIRSHLGAGIVSQADIRRSVVVAYEADDLDPVRRLGWSVIVTGTARILRDSNAIARYRRLPRPWLAGEKESVIAVEPQIVTGIRLVES